jgi:DNA (cytosine-5)-methyltransferase 1
MPRMLDLFCGEGGAAVGYHQAGFDVYGVDLHDKSKRFPYAFHQGDALVVIHRLLLGEAVPFTHSDGRIEWLTLDDFDAIHASPPCQGYSVTRFTHNVEYPLLVEPLRDLLIETSKLWVIENVPGAPLNDPITLCGSMFGDTLTAIDTDGEKLILRRHRLFESSHPLVEPEHIHDPNIRVGGVYGGGPWQRDKNKGRSGYTPVQSVREQLMGGLSWMTRRGLNESIPPAYTEFIGRQLLEVI